MHSFASMVEDSNPFLDLDEKKNMILIQMYTLDSIYHQIHRYSSAKKIQTSTYGTS